MDGTRSDTALNVHASPNDVSRREVVFRLGAGGLGALLLAAGQRPSGVAAQDATPAANPSGAIGVSAQLLGAGQPGAAPGLELTLRRVTLAPGGSLSAHSHPGALVIYIESGTWAHTSLGGTSQVTRAAVGGTPGPVEEVSVGVEVIFNPGDVLFVDDPQDDVRNAGDDDVVLLVAGLTRIGEPFTTFMPDMGTAATPAP